MKLAILTLVTAATLFAQQKPWREILEERLPYYGHRNWIVIADSAYPLQSAPGIETIVSTENQTDTVRHVLDVLSKARHVRPVAYTDLELKHVPEAEAAGIDA